MKKKWFVVSAALCITALSQMPAQEYRVVDWKNRAQGEIAAPEWLLPAARGDWRLFKANWNVPAGKVLKLVVVIDESSKNAAMKTAELRYAASLANQLRQQALMSVARTLDDDAEFDTLLDVVNKALPETITSIARQGRLTDFWQKVETNDERGKKVTKYNYYIVYALDEATWNEIVAKYLLDIIGQVPEKQTLPRNSRQ